MSIHVALNHITHYRYDRRVNLSPQVVRLRPAPHCRTPILSYSLTIEPADHFVNWQQDPFANHLARLVFPEPTTEFKVTVDLVAEMAVYNPFDFFLEPEAENYPFDYAPELKHDLAPYLVKGEATPKFQTFVDSLSRDTVRSIDFLVGLNQRLQHDIGYLIRMEPGVQTPEVTLTNLSGSCRDTGWLMVQVLRHMGLAARFVSGYLIQLKPDVKSLDGPSGTEVDFTDLHAWCEVFLPGAGWVGFDPTSGLMAGEGHIPVACTPEPSTAAPVSGAVDECEVSFEHHMGITRIYESPRVTKPYTDAQWQGILQLGDQVDAQLQQQDVRLTMGGEPTFVSVDDRDGGEWNIDALGPTKRGFATELVHRLLAKYGAGGFQHFGQGKWYPGEQLPRWALTIGWRADGEPCWQDPSLFADERETHRYTSDDAKAFMHALTARLGLDPQYVQPGYEDTWYFLWREHRLPLNVDPFDARLDDELERARLRRVFTQGLDSVVGYLLPLKREMQDKAAGPQWMTSPWFLRDKRLYLMPGDSPMGWRLPLDSLPWAEDGDEQTLIEQDPYDRFGPLPGAAALRARFRRPGQDAHQADGGFAEGAQMGSHAQGSHAQGPQAQGSQAQGSQAQAGPHAQAWPDDTGVQGPAAVGAMGGVGDTTAHGEPGPHLPVAPPSRDPNALPGRFESASGLVRTALCVEVRDPQRANGPKAEKKHGGKSGVLYVFMPPLKHLEDFLELLAAIEATTAELGLKVVLEGYPPPRDVRLKILQVTPDPGVIEVNIHPASSWQQLVDHTEFLYDAAHRTRLSTEKFMLDGRHTGTGGGNHFVLGGATPADSPFLRRPDVLASLLTYWHNHPSLSYLFSGMFIGPTSQAPRFDEARDDQTYEIEVAFAELERQMALHEPTGTVPPWVVDRSLRNLLIDVTGNTHRSEFCIDKMYSPDGPTGRLGLLELRAFEMPPHARMSLAQQLLIRSLLAWFWREPYRGTGSGTGSGTGKTRLTRWGTGLHDRFMLPTFVQMDFNDVMAELRGAGYAFDDAWFTPHLEFRFPLIGEVSTMGIGLSIRTALEPWHVMGEEGAPGGTARYVDSSLERVEVKVTGLNDNRHVITANGRALPLQPTGRVGEYVCGVRYRAWQPPSALHPTIGVHAPLTFDIVDNWLQRSLGGCQYHVAHPGGLSHEDFPVNAYTAESRRLARFVQIGHTPGQMSVKPAAPSLEFPFTLDLRVP